MAETTLMFARTARQARRDPGVAYGQPILISILIGVVFAAMFGSIDDLAEFPLPTYRDWVVPGTMFLVAVVGAGFGAAELLRDAQTGYLDRVRVSPANPSALLIGRMAFEFVRGVIAGTVVLAIGLLAGAENNAGAIGYVSIVAMTAGLAFAWNTLFFLSAVKTLNPAAVLGLQPLFFPLLLFSTWFAPRSFMPDWYQTIARLNPISAFLDGQRSILAGATDWGLVWIAVGFIVGLALVGTALATKAYRELAAAH